MLIHGTPIAAALPSDPDFQDRFFYWTGASGRKYIHSVYALDDCPPLPGAIYVAVRREGPLRLLMGIGRFSRHRMGNVTSGLAVLRGRGVDEIHVHLLAKSSEVADAVLEDLLQATDTDDEVIDGFAEVPQQILS
jgi:hypothetical protein